MLRSFKSFTSKLPKSWSQSLRRNYFRYRFRYGSFSSDEYEYSILHEFVKPNDCVVDIGANCGVYTARLSELVGPGGRVIALEPVPESFDILTSVVQGFLYKNVTLLNVGASNEHAFLHTRIPAGEDGLKNYYLAELTADGGAEGVLVITVDCLQIPSRVTLVKIDVEGFELRVLQGMEQLLRRDHPVLIVEWMPEMEAVREFVKSLGYVLTPPRKSDRYVYQNELFLAEKAG